ncbi:hypothetical protein PTTG_28624 [Puccinia triticina 1-1 BBBD Race 1]|uniref:BSD domain-containing protein n=1 Tax=Puccinia triticina (isolate 1-1 / race 1 (BBBD)) TaxID=630390 RepID=A0A180GB15_PUCT1|nr:hypothetical protein PTTG_28624 [Puccinia triticina 1-1 BBBD Race 1]
MDIPSVYDHPQAEATATATASSTTAPTITEPNTKSPNEDSHPLSDQTTPSSIESSAQTITNLPATSEATGSNLISLDQEIIDLKKTLGGVSASLGGWWGKVQKQSAEALAATNITAQINTARKDLASLNLIEKAKKEVERLGDQAKEGYAVISSEIEKGPDLESTEGRIVNVDGVELPAPSRDISSSSSSITITKDNKEGPTSPKGKERAPDQNQATNEGNASPNSILAFDASSIGSFFSKLTQDSESLTATLQSKISHLPHPPHVPARLTSSGKFDLSEVQKLAEGYLAKGEVYLQDVGKELKEFVQDAVKVIPPSESDQADQPEEGPSASTPSGTVSVTEKRRMLDVKREAMLSKLRRDESQLLADPREEDENLQNAFDEFMTGVQQAGGLEGEAWKKKILAELESEDSDQVALKALLEKLVPNCITDETFWTRYFFRIHRIDQEEAARRVVLSAAQEDNEGDFSWDMEDESEPPSPVVIVKSHQEVSGKVVEERRGQRDEQAETPKLSKLSNPKLGAPATTDKDEQLPTEDDWGNSPIDATAASVEPVAKPAASSSTTKSRSTSNNEARRNSASEPDTNDSFDVVSAQQSSDEKPKKSATVSADNNKHDDDDDSDWE